MTGRAKHPGVLRALQAQLGMEIGRTVRQKVAIASRLDRIMREHGMTDEDVFTVIQYAQRNRKLVNVPESLPYLVPAARVEKARLAYREPDPLESQIASALETELAMFGDTSWADRLIRARGDSRTKVLQAWAEVRGQ